MNMILASTTLLAVLLALFAPTATHAQDEQAPTRNPTARPSSYPTKRPSINPTRQPTRSPTQGPSRSPTFPPAPLSSSRKNINEYEKLQQAFLIYDYTYLGIGGSNPQDDTNNDPFQVETVVLWLGPPTIIRDNQGNIEQIVARSIKYSPSASSSSSSSFEKNIHPKGFAAIYNDSPFDYYDATIAGLGGVVYNDNDNNNYNNNNNVAKFMEAGASKVSILETNPGLFVGTRKARWKFVDDNNFDELRELQNSFGRALTPESFEDAYRMAVVATNNNNNIIEPPKTPQQKNKKAKGLKKRGKNDVAVVAVAANIELEPPTTTPQQPSLGEEVSSKSSKKSHKRG